MCLTVFEDNTTMKLTLLVSKAIIYSYLDLKQEYGNYNKCTKIQMEVYTILTEEIPEVI